MHHKDIDWSVIRGALIGLVLSILISATLVMASFYFKEAMNREYNSNNASFMNISRRYLAIDEEERQIKTYLPEFIALYKKGIIGEEQRLNWIEAMKTSEAAVKLPAITYTINSQRSYAPAFPVDLGRFQVYASEMTMHLSLLHEGDLLALLDGMNEKANGIYSVDECKFSKTGDIILDNPKAANVTVECNVDWYTIKLADGTEIKV
jgi:hypothetical protein